ncbi:MAG: hypothetical protein QOH10_2602 [Actinomycetota bacterium]|nr:hypothetical protein [Actinomycetota bacterium]
MSSHREAPEMCKDPAADSTDLYAFVSPDNPDMVTLIANYVPLQQPSGGPNFFEFGDDVLYTINIDNNGDGRPDIKYKFRFKTVLKVGGTFLYNVGPIQSLDSPNWNRRQLVSVWRTDHEGGEKAILNNVPCPPCNIGPLSTPDYAAVASTAIHDLPHGGKFFAGQRAEAFYVDLGSVFDLADLRPFEQLHTHFGLHVPELTRPKPGVNATKAVNVHSIAIQIPKTDLTADGSNPTDPASAKSVIGVWTTANRRQVRILSEDANNTESGPHIQVSRLGNPLINEALVPMERKDYWNTQHPHEDSAFVDGVAHPELGNLLPVLYPGVFPNLAALNASGKPRNDLIAILMTGIPSGIVAGFQNYTGPTIADMLRLNMAIPPASSPNNLGLIGGDPAGYPNGRRTFDDVFTIELRCIAGVSYPLVDPSYTADGAAAAVTDGLTTDTSDQTAEGTVKLLPDFPYLGTPHSGFDIPALHDSSK